MILYVIHLCDAWSCVSLDGYYFTHLETCLREATRLVQLLGGSGYCFTIGG